MQVKIRFNTGSNLAVHEDSLTHFAFVRNVMFREMDLLQFLFNVILKLYLEI